VLHIFFHLLDRSENYTIFNVWAKLLSSLWSIYHSTTAYFLTHTVCIHRQITTRSSTRSLRSSSAPLLHVPFRRTSFGKCSFSTAAPSGTLSLSPFRTVTRLHYLNLDLKHICSLPFMLLNCPVRQRLWSHGNMALYKFCIVIYRVSQKSDPLNILQQQPQIRSDLNKIFHTQDDFCYKHYYIVSYKSALTSVWKNWTSGKRNKGFLWNLTSMTKIDVVLCV